MTRFVVGYRSLVISRAQVISHMKHHLDNWGSRELKAGEKLIRRMKNFFAGLGLAFTTAIFVLGFSILIIWGFYLLRRAIESQIASSVISSLSLTKKTGQPIPSANPPQVGIPGQSSAMESPSSTEGIPQPSDGLIYTGFTDLFSSTAGLNQSETTMYRDDSATALMFQPSVQWNEKDGGSMAPDFSSACIGNSCLSASGAVLKLNGSPIKLPIAGDVDNVTADVVGNGWAVGIVLKTDGGYAGYAYLFDGNLFSPIFPNGGKAFDSQYEGQWGFGGTADDFLAVYGAYQGKGYRVRGNNISDISNLFDVRMMKGGIRPSIVKAGNGNHAAWYIFNEEENNRAVFVKLFQNGTPDIVGEADLSGTFPAALSYLAVTGASNQFPFSLSVYGEWAGTSHTWNVVDNGFKIPSGSVAAVSVNLNNYQNVEIPYLIGLTPKDFSAGGANVTFEARNTDSGTWEAVSPGVDHWFSNSHGAALEWRMTVKPGGNPEYTPYLGDLLVEYKVKRL